MQLLVELWLCLHVCVCVCGVFVCVCVFKHHACTQTHKHSSTHTQTFKKHPQIHKWHVDGSSFDSLFFVPLSLALFFARARFQYSPAPFFPSPSFLSYSRFSHLPLPCLSLPHLHPPLLPRSCGSLEHHFIRLEMVGMEQGRTYQKYLVKETYNLFKRDLIFGGSHIFGIMHKLSHKLSKVPSTVTFFSEKARTLTFWECVFCDFSEVPLKETYDLFKRDLVFGGRWLFENVYSVISQAIRPDKVEKYCPKGWYENIRMCVCVCMYACTRM